MRIAIVGGGLFGCTAAIHLARAGHKVELYDKSDRILGAASGINQFRLHQGYHYPRSPETARECQAALKSFASEYGAAVLRGGDRFYAIAGDGSRVSGADYLAFCNRHGLPFSRFEPISDALDVMIKVAEASIDPVMLQALVMAKLVRASVIVRTEAAAHRGLLDDFDQVIVASYAGTNDVLAEFDRPTSTFQFEVVEKPVIKLPEKYRDFGMVVMDGPFCCVDPLGATGLHVMGHVTHAIHATNVGLHPEVPEHLKCYLNRGIVEKPEGSCFDKFIAAGREFIPFLDKAEHVGSMFTVRAVLPDMDATDARPTLVTRLDESVIRVFSGKLGCACQAATRVVQMLSPSRDRTDDREELVA